jgi:transcriptional regulator with XRE-family HTH domain
MSTRASLTGEGIVVDGEQLARLRRQRTLTQEQLAERAGCSADTIRRLEQGRRDSARLSTLEAIADALGVSTAAFVRSSGRSSAQRPTSAAVPGSAGGNTEVGEMNRRELLRLVSASTATLAVNPASGLSDEASGELGRHAAGAPLTAAAAAELEAVNVRLWKAIAGAPSKVNMFPAVRAQAARLTEAARRPQRGQIRRTVSALISDVFQLAGEILFDANRYGDAEQCYTLAATAAREAAAMDLWACAMTRHAYISVYEQQYNHAVPLLELAVRLARNGDTTMSTRHWASAVLGQALAGTGDHAGCERALETAENVRDLTHPHNGGWLRFDAGRLAEDRAACYLQQHRPDLAEPVLTALLREHHSSRRRGITLVDLARIGAMRRDRLRLVTHATAALDHARSTASGVIVRRLHNLRPHLVPLRADPHVRHLDDEIARLAAAPA